MEDCHPQTLPLHSPALAQKQRMLASISATPLAVTGYAYAAANSLPKRATSRQIELASATNPSEAPLHPPTLAQKQRVSASLSANTGRGRLR